MTFAAIFATNTLFVSIALSELIYMFLVMPPPLIGGGIK